MDASDVRRQLASRLLDRSFDRRSSGCVEPVALADGGVPAADLLEVLLDLLDFAHREPLAEGLKLDLGDDRPLAFLGDLPVLLTREITEAADHSRLLVGGLVRERKEVSRAAHLVDLVSHLLEFRAGRAKPWEHAYGLLEIQCAQTLELTPYPDAVGGSIGWHPVREQPPAHRVAGHGRLPLRLHRDPFIGRLAAA
ncbi:MAG TPA: hypothetical protein VGS17_05730 [Candidatus Limnocylindria bacterium]|nr:hypothetical protein [Candidatus Limnocylindria bacterium]